MHPILNKQCGQTNISKSNLIGQGRFRGGLRTAAHLKPCFTQRKPRPRELAQCHAAQTTRLDSMSLGLQASPQLSSREGMEPLQGWVSGCHCHRDSTYLTHKYSWTRETSTWHEKPLLAEVDFCCFSCSAPPLLLRGECHVARVSTVGTTVPSPLLSKHVTQMGQSYLVTHRDYYVH